MTKNARPHAETIKLWADGADIQYRHQGTGEWVDCPEPAWTFDYDYRVKPPAPARVYPVTMMTGHELEEVFDYAPHVGKAIDAARTAFVAIANAALRHAIDYGYLVTREEFGHAIGDRAARDLAVSIAVRDKCRELTVRHAMRSGVVHDIERLDLFAIIDSVKS